MSDAVRVTALVPVDPATAFEIFTRETALWWRRDLRFRVSGDAPGALTFEGEPADRVIERFDDGRVVEIGRVLVWEPGYRVMFEWTSRCLPAGRTEDDVRFTERQHLTEVTVEHRGLERPYNYQASREQLALWWADLITAYRQRLHEGSAASGTDMHDRHE